MDKAEFLEKYEALCREAGWVVDACGCCSSPWAVEIKEEFKSLAEHMSHLRSE